MPKLDNQFSIVCVCGTFLLRQKYIVTKYYCYTFTEAQGGHGHKNVNLFKNFVGLTIADDLKSKIWKVYENIFSLHPQIRV